MRRKYGLGSFLFDSLMTVFTCGFWLIWIFVREMRAR
jgi:hypothetical protein